MCLPKIPGLLADPERAARRAHRRGVLSFGYFSLHKQRKVTRAKRETLVYKSSFHIALCILRPQATPPPQPLEAASRSPASQGRALIAAQPQRCDSDTDIRMSRPMHKTLLILSIYVLVLSINDNTKTDHDACTVPIPNYMDMREKHCIS